ncbi:MAG: response regulator transcription factor [Bacteroidota bacterium]
MKDTTITIIDDEKDILELLKYNFEKERAQVHTFTSGYRGLEFIKANRPGVIICDWMLEDIDGIEICRKLKNDKNYQHIPFIMLTARDNEIDAVTALELGADDFIPKPVRVRELISRVKKRVQKTKAETKVSVDHHSVLEAEDSGPVGELKTFKNLTIDSEKYKAYTDEEILNLTHSEFKLLYLFVNKPGKVYSRNQIIEKLNGIDYIVTERSIDVQIVGLRQKLGKYKDYLETVRGIGYRLRE